MSIDEFVKLHFDVELNEQGEWIIWDEHCTTMYNPFVNNMFDDVIQQGLDAGKTYEDIVRDMIKKSIMQNYGLTEYMIRHTGISLF